MDEERCTTCGGTGLVDWAPGQIRDSEEPQQPCPDCPETRCQCDPCPASGDARCARDSRDALNPPIIASTHCARCINYCLADD